MLKVFPSYPYHIDNHVILEMNAPFAVDMQGNYANICVSCNRQEGKFLVAGCRARRSNLCLQGVCVQRSALISHRTLTVSFMFTASLLITTSRFGLFFLLLLCFGFGFFFQAPNV